jgi:hypothetical protein
VFGNPVSQQVAVFWRKILDFRLKIPFHPLDIRWRVPKDKHRDLLTQFTTGDCLPEFLTFTCNRTVGIPGFDSGFAADD